MNKRYSIWIGGFVLAWGILHAGCVGGESAFEAEDDETEEVGVAPQASEVLALDVTESRKCELFGKRTDYDYPLDGRRVTRHDFKVATTGHADAKLTRKDNHQFSVHAWCDAFSSYTFTLKVWVEQ